MVHLNAPDLPAEAEARSADGAGAASAGERVRSAERSRPYAHLAHGPGLPDPVIKRLLCAGRIRTAVHDGHGNVCDLGRSHRLVNRPAVPRALLLRDGGCTHPGCHTTANPATHIDTDRPVEHEHPDVTGTAASTKWSGEPLDTWAVGVRAGRRELHRPAS